MRLWHQLLIPHIDRQRLLGQHRECCALRGNGWLKKHATINYIFNYDLEHLFAYHTLVMNEMSKRGYQVNDDWRNPLYRGKKCKPLTKFNHPTDIDKLNNVIYLEHNNTYLQECLNNLQQKGANLYE